MPFIPNTDADRKIMLEKIGVTKFDELVANIPDELKFKEDFNLPDEMSELEVTRFIQQKVKNDQNVNDTISFLGGGAYDHFVPAAISHILSRPEFYTAYTPYQPEVSQGTLQAIYEFQSMISELMGMDIANASMYDGGSALAEAVLVAIAETRRKKIVVARTVHPFYRQVIQTYCYGLKIEIEVVNFKNGITDLSRLKDSVDDKTAAIVIEHPNFFGCLEDVFEISKIAQEHGALFITSNDPLSLGILEPPGKYGVDIATGEGQCLGNSLNFGGPYLGVFTSKEKYIRRMPGRIAGETTDNQNRRGFVLTFQTREQHIRRERATSNICTNEALNALAATVYLALMGKSGIKQVGNLCIQNSHYLAEQIEKIDGYQLAFSAPFFKEFVVITPINPKIIIEQLAENNIQAGIDLSQFDAGLDNALLIAATEKRTKQDMDTFVKALANIVK